MASSNSSDTVRIGIIGFGGMGSSHAGYLTKNEVPGATLAAVCDVAPDRLAKAKENYGDAVQLFDEPEKLFAAKAVDAVMIATPHYYHPPLAMRALENGLHALVEKPAGVYTRQVREMNEAAAKSDKVLGIMFNQRTSPAHQKMRDLVASGELGEIKRTMYVITDWLRTQAYYDSGGWRGTWGGEGGGVLMNQSPHNLDLWQWIAGMPSRVRAFCSFGKYHNIEVEDDVTAYVEYPNGGTGVFITSTGQAPGRNFLEITGDRGQLLLEKGQITFWRTTVPVSEHIRTHPGGFSRPPTWKCEIPVEGSGEGHKGITKNWVQAIRTGTPLLARGEEGINGVQLANAMLLSTWTDSWVDIPVNEDAFYNALQEKISTSTFQKGATEGNKAMDFAGTFGV